MSEHITKRINRILWLEAGAKQIQTLKNLSVLKGRVIDYQNNLSSIRMYFPPLNIFLKNVLLFKQKLI